MAFNVFFTGDEELKSFPDSVRFRIGDNGVLTITDGEDVRHIAPHAWREVRNRRPKGQSRVILSE